MAVELDAAEVLKLAPGLDPKVVEAFVPGVLSMAILAAPCLGDVAPDSLEANAAKLILCAAIARLAGAAQGVEDGGIQTESAGVFSVTYRPTVGTLSDNEERKLREICSPRNGKAFALDTTPITVERDCPKWGYVPGYPQSNYDGGRTQPKGCGGHLPWCSTMTDMGCTCGWVDR